MRSLKQEYLPNLREGSGRKYYAFCEEKLFIWQLIRRAVSSLLSLLCVNKREMNMWDKQAISPSPCWTRFAFYLQRSQLLFCHSWKRFEGSRDYKKGKAAARESEWHSEWKTIYFSSANPFKAALETTRVDGKIKHFSCWQENFLWSFEYFVSSSWDKTIAWMDPCQKIIKMTTWLLCSLDGGGASCWTSPSIDIHDIKMTC